MRLLKVIPLVAVLLQSPVELASAQEDSTVWIRQSEVFADPADENATNDEPLRMRLEIASQRFDATIPGSGPVTLVGVTHIGDAGYYDALGELLAGFDVVLYESVAPDGARGVSGVDHPGRTSETLAAMEFVGFAIEWHRMDRGSLPAGLPELIENAGAMDTRFPRLAAGSLGRCLGHAAAVGDPRGTASKG